MTRLIAATVLLTVALGCGKKGGDTPRLPGEAASPAGAPPGPTQQERTAFVRALGKHLIGGADIGDPVNGARGPIYELSDSVTDADIQAIRDPGFAFGLRLTSPKLTDASLAACGRLPSLVYFGIGKAKALTATGAAELAHLKNLAVLELTDLRADDTWLAALKSLTDLRKLGLNGCYNVTDAGLAHLSGMTHLRELQLHNTKVTGSGLGALANAKELSRVVLPEQTDAALKAMAKIGKLHALEEALTEKEERPKSAAEVVKFALRGPVSDAGLKEVKALPNLTHLYLRSDKVTPASLPFLKTLKKLKYLEPARSFTQEHLDELKAALPGCEVR